MKLPHSETSRSEALFRMQKNMKNNWFFMDFDGGDPYSLSTIFFLSRSLGGPLFSQSSYLHFPLSQTLEEAFTCVSKFTGALLFWFTSGSGSNLSRRINGNQNGLEPGSSKSSVQVKQITSRGHSFAGFHFGSESESECVFPVVFSKISSSAIRNLFREGGKLQLSPVLSLAAAVVPPFGNISSKILAIPSGDAEVQMRGCLDQSPCEVEAHRCDASSFPALNKRKHAVEPRTGIEFPTILENVLEREKSCRSTPEVLVGTGSRTMKIIKLKSLKVYAFAFYVHPRSVCERLGPKYASFPAGELNKRSDFYEDLLREDIDMTVRLVINCNGIKVNTVKDAFEKSLRARLVKTNPDTDFHCLKNFGSCFPQDISLPVGTTIDFRRTADGQLITKIGGNQMGAVHSKDLCRAFFDMYIGDLPVSEQSKDEIGRNVASMVRRC